jgi:hypothetical protein
MSETTALFDVLFVPGNELTPDRTGAFTPFVERLSSDPRASTIAPVRRAGCAWIYALPASPTAASRLHDDLQACLGPTFLGPPRHRLEPDDPIDGPVQQAIGGYAWKHEVPTVDPALRSEFSSALHRLEQVQRLAPDPPREERGPGEVYRRFRTALASGDREGAWRALEDLRAWRLLDPSNLLFLEVELLATLDGDSDLLAWRSLPDVLSAPRPSAVSAAIAGAVYRAHLLHHEYDGNANALITAIASERLTPYLPGLEAAHPCSDPDARLAFIARAVASGRAKVAGELTAGLGPRESFARDLLALLSGEATAPASPVGPREMIDRGLYIEAAQELLGLDDSPERAALLTACAFYAGDPRILAVAEQAYFALNEEDRDRLLHDRVLGELIAEVHGATGGKPGATLDGWADAIEAVRSSDEPHAVLGRVRERASNWSLEELAQRPEEVTRLAESIQATDPPDATDAVQVVKIDLAAAVTSQAEPRPELAPVAFSLLEDLASVTGGAPNEMMLIGGLVGHALVQPASHAARERYCAVLEVATATIQATLAPTTNVSALDLLEIVAERPVLDRSACVRLFDALAAGLHRFEFAAGDTRWDVLRSLAVRADLAEWAEHSTPPPPTPEERVAESATLAALSGRRVGIYTLMAPAGRRAAEIIQQAAPGVEVRVFSTMVAEKRLLDWARTADIFVVCVHAAKHAATEAIKRARGGELLIEPRGKGSSAILTGLSASLAASG